ncbi:MAG: sulfatase [Bacteroidota bacterium]
MIKINLLSIVGVAFLLVGCLEKSSTATNQPQIDSPNIVLIVADDLGWSDLGCYGNTYFESPYLDSLAQLGVRFTQAYSAGHVCSPTRASLLTGRYPARIGLTNYLYGTKTVDDSPVLPAPFEDRLPLEEITLAEELKQDGYQTALMGKWHLGENTSFGESDPQFHGFDMTVGFDYELLPVGDSYEWFKIGDTTQAYQLPHLTEEITRNSVDFITQYRDTTFFLMVTHYAVHLPLQGDSALVAKYQAKENPRPDDFHPVYGAMIEQMDQSVGAIVNSLKTNRLMDNTLVIFVSDNGGLAVGEAGAKPTVNDPLRAGKGTMFEGGIRVPMIAHWPGHIEGGLVNTSVLSTVDLYPTLHTLVSSTDQIAHTIDGVNRLSAFTSPIQVDRSALYWHYPHFSNQGGRPRAAVRVGDFKLIRSLEDSTTELYNVVDDLAEQHELSEQLPQKVQQLNDSLENWFHEVNATMPIPRTE